MVATRIMYGPDFLFIAQSRETSNVIISAISLVSTWFVAECAKYLDQLEFCWEVELYITVREFSFAQSVVGMEYQKAYKQG